MVEEKNLKDKQEALKEDMKDFGKELKELENELQVFKGKNLTLIQQNKNLINMINWAYDKLIAASKAENPSFEIGKIAESLRVQFLMTTNQKLTF